MTKVSLPYRIILKKIHEQFREKEVDAKELKKAINIRFRFGKDVGKLLIDMKKKGLIEYLNSNKVRINLDSE